MLGAKALRYEKIVLCDRNPFNYDDVHQWHSELAGALGHWTKTYPFGHNPTLPITKTAINDQKKGTGLLQRAMGSQRHDC